MKYLCLVYAEEERIAKLADGEWDALVAENLERKPAAGTRPIPSVSILNYHFTGRPGTARYPGGRICAGTSCRDGIRPGCPLPLGHPQVIACVRTWEGKPPQG